VTAYPEITPKMEFCPGRRPPNPESIIADDQKSLVLLFDPEARLLFGPIQAKVMNCNRSQGWSYQWSLNDGGQVQVKKLRGS
jgi:hypothetical protein